MQNAIANELNQRFRNVLIKEWTIDEREDGTRILIAHLDNGANIRFYGGIAPGGEGGTLIEGGKLIVEWKSVEEKSISL